ncbi:MAG TPA: YbhB/YbcL family Raf kinase inhibitor-like protein [Candidatus Saccharimonadales bacterium]|nr:YbhB/YbcL family Raf kinase inhibitor-like protein [Candidatus Saccharimonadales bacterium]
MKLTSTDFGDNEPLPYASGYDQGSEAPRLDISDVPPGTSSLALLVRDPDAPSGDYTHWIVWNIPPTITELVADNLPAGVMQGTNDFGELGFSGPAPPSGTHHYHFVLYALDNSPALPAGTKRAVFDQVIANHVVAKTELVGLYSAPGT